METLLRELIDPALRRLGTAVAAGLVGYGVAHDTASVIATGVVAVVGVGFDLFQSHLNRNRAK